MKIFWDFLNGFINGLREIFAHKIRSFLSMLGIILGVAALVAMISIIEDMYAKLKKSFEENGGIELIEVVWQEVPAEQLEFASLSKGLTVSDCYAIENSVPLVSCVAPILSVPRSNIVGKKGRTWGMVFATNSDFLEIKKLEIAKGRNLSDVDGKNRAMVAVIGSDVAKAIFKKNENPIGKTIKYSGQTLTVIGVTKHYELMQDGRNTIGRKNRYVLIPVESAMSRWGLGENVNSIQIKIKDVDYMPETLTQLENVLDLTHNGIEDYEIRTNEDALASIQETAAQFKYSLGGIALISLLVGGIGIMNVMLAVINERIREIGVRKAVGARSADIFIQFLAEAIVISCLGGFLGMLTSIGLVEIFRLFIPDLSDIKVSLDALMQGFMFSVCIGIIAGIYPALRAARLDPIEALRYE